LRALPAIEQFLDGIERHHFGGTCYAANYYLTSSFGPSVTMRGCAGPT
jgi:hypothetical protein